MCVGALVKGDNAVDSHVLSSLNDPHPYSPERTFAGLYAFRPPVINFVVASTSTVPKPSTARSATTESAGFLEHAAL